MRQLPHSGVVRIRYPPKGGKLFEVPEQAGSAQPRTREGDFDLDYTVPRDPRCAEVCVVAVDEEERRQVFEPTDRVVRSPARLAPLLPEGGGSVGRDSTRLRVGRRARSTGAKEHGRTQPQPSPHPRPRRMHFLITLSPELSFWG